jgi:hypothetical protein
MTHVKITVLLLADVSIIQLILTLLATYIHIENRLELR